jgi:hypothetical protein
VLILVKEVSEAEYQNFTWVFERLRDEQHRSEPGDCDGCHLPEVSVLTANPPATLRAGPRRAAVVGRYCKRSARAAGDGNENVGTSRRIATVMRFGVARAIVPDSPWLERLALGTVHRSVSRALGCAYATTPPWSVLRQRVCHRNPPTHGDGPKELRSHG